MSEWQTIDSAPKDGTQFLATCPPTTQGDPAPVAVAKIIPQGEYREGTCQWDADGEPTHWMPLPETPTAAAAAQYEATVSQQDGVTKANRAANMSPGERQAALNEARKKAAEAMAKAKAEKDGDDGDEAAKPDDEPANAPTDAPATFDGLPAPAAEQKPATP